MSFQGSGALLGPPGATGAPVRISFAVPEANLLQCPNLKCQQAGASILYMWLVKSQDRCPSHTSRHAASLTCKTDRAVPSHGDPVSLSVPTAPAYQTVCSLVWSGETLSQDH